MPRWRPPRLAAKPVRSLEPVLFLAVFLGFFCLIGSRMGAVNMLSTMMNTAYQLLLDTVFYIMAVAVLAGALLGLFSEFGVVALVNRLLSPLMKPLYGMPGAASLAMITTYLSDNPAILSLAHDKSFRRFFKKYQLPALTNIGTAFGMGAIVTTFMMSQTPPSGESLVTAALVGNAGALVGSIVSTRLMLRRTAKVFGKDAPCDEENDSPEMATSHRVVREGGVGMRAVDALMDGGKTGVALGLDIIPGVLIVCTLVLMLTNGPSESGLYTGAAYEGVAFFPWLGEKLSFILTPLFGFTSTESIAVPITALGSAGAAIGLVPKLLANGSATACDVAVFTAMCMCWSGYLSTHVAMMNNLKFGRLAGRTILAQTAGGLCAGVAAHWLYRLVSLF